MRLARQITPPFIRSSANDPESNRTIAAIMTDSTMSRCSTSSRMPVLTVKPPKSSLGTVSAPVRFCGVIPVVVAVVRR